jgi:hypothetical protein
MQANNDRANIRNHSHIYNSLATLAEGESGEFAELVGWRQRCWGTPDANGEILLQIESGYLGVQVWVKPERDLRRVGPAGRVLVSRSLIARYGYKPRAPKEAKAAPATPQGGIVYG